MRGLFTSKNVDFSLSGQCFRLWFVGTTPPTFVTWNRSADFLHSEQPCQFPSLGKAILIFLHMEQSCRLWFVGKILPTLLDETNQLTFVCQCTDEFLFDRLTREEITGGITVD